MILVIYLKVNLLDFSTCEIHQVIIPMEQLKGLTVSTEQAVQLAQLLGLKIV